MNIQTDRQMTDGKVESQPGKKTDKQTDKWKNEHIDRQTDGQMEK